MKSLGMLIICCLGLLLLPERSLSVLVTDQLGRSVQVPENPRRIVALAPSLTECVFALGQGGRLVGTTRFSNYPVQAQRTEKVGSYVRLDLEKIVALNPDLCLATKDGNPEAVIRRLEGLGIAVYALDPRDMQGLLSTLIQLGRLLQAEAASAVLVKEIRQGVQGIQKRLPAKSQWPRVFFQIGIAPIVSVGTETFVHELMQLAGGLNLAAGSIPYPRYSREEVLHLNPDIILINSMTGDEDLVQRTRQDWMRFPEIRAVKTKRIVGVNADLCNRPSPRMVQALETLFAVFYPGSGLSHD